MPEVDSNRKRSRSPSDSDQKQHKRVNTGGASLDGPLANSTGSLFPSTPSDITMTMANSSSAVSNANDTNSSTPNSSAKKEETTDDKNLNEDRKDGKESATTSGEPSSSTTGPPPSANIHMRCLIVTQDASIIIGKGGSHVNEIREKSGARVMVSESIPGNPERILNVSGPLDAVSKVVYTPHLVPVLTNFCPIVKAFGLIVRRINDEPFDVPSVPGSRAVTIKFMIPNSRMGSVIGKQGSKIKEIQDASGARLNASEGMLPGSTEVNFSLCRNNLGPYHWL